MTVATAECTPSRRNAGLRRLSDRRPRARHGNDRADARVRRTRLRRLPRSDPPGRPGATPLRSPAPTNRRASRRDNTASRAAASPRCPPSSGRPLQPPSGVTTASPRRPSRACIVGAAGRAVAESVDNCLRRIVSDADSGQIDATASAETWDALGTTVVLRLDTWTWPSGRRQARRRARARRDRCGRESLRSDSELSRVNRAAGAWVQIGPFLRDAITLAIHAAQVTDGAVDPTLGCDLIDLGYDRDWRELEAGQDDREERTRPPRRRPVSNAWRLVELDNDPPSVRCPEAYARPGCDRQSAGRRPGRPRSSRSRRRRRVGGTRRRHRRQRSRSRWRLAGSRHR